MHETYFPYSHKFPRVIISSKKLLKILSHFLVIQLCSVGSLYNGVVCPYRLGCPCLRLVVNVQIAAQSVALETVAYIGVKSGVAICWVCWRPCTVFKITLFVSNTRCNKKHMIVIEEAIQGLSRQKKAKRFAKQQQRDRCKN